MKEAVSIRRVESRKDFKDFLKLPWRIYGDDPNWVPPLLRDVKSTFYFEKNPFLKHAKVELFLARRDDQTLGRIVAIIDHNHNQFHQEKTGFFGFFEVTPDYSVAKALLDRARVWCQGKDMNLLRGPMNPSMNDECAFLLEGFDSPPVIMMPYNPPYYLEFMETYGFYKAKDLYAFLKEVKDGIPERIEGLVERMKRREELVVRPLDMRHLKGEVELIKEIYNSAWERNWGFVPMTDEEMDLMAKRLKPIAVPELVLFAEVRGEPIGVSVTIPDYNQVLKRLNGKLVPWGMIKFLYYRRKIDGLRALVFGIKREYRGKGVSLVLYHEAEKVATRLGYRWCELSWNLEDNDLINSFDTAVGGRLYKKYRIYEMEI